MLSSTKLRLSAMVAATGVASRRQAELMIKEGRVALGGETLKNPSMLVDDSEAQAITVDGVPLKANSFRTTLPPRLWVVSKVSAEVVSKSDSKGRRSIYDRLKLSPQLPKDLYPVFMLNYLTEGMLLLTNSPSMATFLNGKGLDIPMHCKVRVHGLLTESKLRALQYGVTIGETKSLPMKVSVLRRSHTVSWLSLSSSDKRPKVVQRALEQLHLKLYRTICVGFGPFTAPEKATPDAVTEVKLPPALNAKYLEWALKKHPSPSSHVQTN